VDYIKAVLVELKSSRKIMMLFFEKYLSDVANTTADGARRTELRRRLLSLIIICIFCLTYSMKSVR